MGVEQWLRGQKTLAEVEAFEPAELLGLAHLGNTLYLQGKTDSARAIFEGLLVLQPDDPFVHSALGAIYLREERPADAERHLNRALDLNPRDTVALCNRGELHIRAGRLREAVRDLKRAVDLDPRGQDGAAMRARALIAVVDDLVRRGRTT